MANKEPLFIKHGKDLFIANSFSNELFHRQICLKLF